MVLYVNGCSHSVGACVGHSDNWARSLMKELTSSHDFYTSVHLDEFKRTNENLLFNCARNGSGNDYIFHSTLEHITALINKSLKPDLVVIQWSGPNRRYSITPDGDVFFINLYDNVEYHIKFEPMGTENTIHYMFLMQEFLKSNGIEYYFFNYMKLDQSMVNSFLFKKLDFDNFVDFGLGRGIMNYGLMSLIKEMGYGCNGDIDLHPNLIGNKFIKDEIIKKMNKTDYSKYTTLI